MAAAAAAAAAAAPRWAATCCASARCSRCSLKTTARSFPSKVAVATQLPQDVDSSYSNNTATRAEEWCTRLGIEVDVNATAEAFPALNNSIYFFLCFSQPALQCCSQCMTAVAARSTPRCRFATESCAPTPSPPSHAAPKTSRAAAQCGAGEEEDEQDRWFDMSTGEPCKNTSSNCNTCLLFRYVSAGNRTATESCGAGLCFQKRNAACFVHAHHTHHV